MQKEFVKTLERKNKVKDKIDYDKKYALDDYNIIIRSKKLLKNKNIKKKFKK